jgi:N-acetylneuraminic acid mutarotase
MSFALLAIGLVATTTVHAFAQASGTWAATGSPNIPRIAHTATLLANGQVLVAGGEDSSSNLIASAELYNPSTGKWTITGSMATPRVSHAAPELPSGEVLVAGGTIQTQLTSQLTSRITRLMDKSRSDCLSSSQHKFIAHTMYRS